MDAICLVVAGIVRAALPEPEFSLAWTHSVARTRWEERYRVDASALTLVEARVEGSGAGMEAPPEALREGAGWIWRPGRRLGALTVARSEYVADYTLCDRAGCRPLGDVPGLAATEGPVTFAPCSSTAR